MNGLSFDFLASNLNLYKVKPDFNILSLFHDKMGPNFEKRKGRFTVRFLGKANTYNNLHKIGLSLENGLMQSSTLFSSIALHLYLPYI